jgi:arabinan endo-1,5-alpha-L-arabinosidase
VTRQSKYIVLAWVAACGNSPAHKLPDAADASIADALLPPDVAIDAPPDGPPGPPMMLDLSGAIAPVHDPSIINSANGFYYVFATGDGLPIHMSVDLINWSAAGQVFATKPAWITTTASSDPNGLWAPDISSFGGEYHLYYAASSFGSNTSCIGHATTASLESPAWVDQGPVICSTSSDNWNAIDPMAVLDEQGEPWLVFGSFWSGIKLIKLDMTGVRSGADFYSLSTRDNTAVEGPYIVRHDGYYYLFESVDHCCMGVDSDYKIFVGRSADIRGPYLDHDGVALLSGGGTQLVVGDDRWKGPGHNAVLHTVAGDYNVYHSYDALANGIPTLRIAQLRWSDVDGWPISAGP